MYLKHLQYSLASKTHSFFCVFLRSVRILILTLTLLASIPSIFLSTSTNLCGESFGESLLAADAYLNVCSNAFSNTISDFYLDSEYSYQCESSLLISPNFIGRFTPSPIISPITSPIIISPILFDAQELVEPKTKGLSVQVYQIDDREKQLQQQLFDDYLSSDGSVEMLILPEPNAYALIVGMILGLFLLFRKKHL